jgi:hypothetical protein
MIEPPAAEAAGPERVERVGHVVELRKEAYTMALYVAICLLAALIGCRRSPSPS